MSADYIITGNYIFDGVCDAPFSGAVIICKEKIADVIKDGDYKEYVGPDTKVIDAKDGLIMPGFVDAHTHFFSAAIAESEYVCTELKDSKSEEDAASMVYEYSKTHPKLDRIRGRGWFVTNWGDAPLPTKESLDRLLPDKPVYLQAADVHSYWLNSAALKECGIDKNKADEIEGIIQMEDGSPSGMLVEIEACTIAEEKYNDFSPGQRLVIYRDYMKKLLRYGVTSLSEMMPFGYDNKTYELYRQLIDLELSGELSARVHIYPSLFEADGFDEALKWKKKLNTDFVKISGVKGFVDGVVETYTGLLLEPYSDRPDTTGDNVPFVDQAELNEAVLEANRAGLSVRIHAIADGSVRMCLDAFEYARDRIDHSEKLHNTIEHIENISRTDIPRFKELGVIPSMQAVHIILDADGKIKRIGPERIELEWPLGSMLKSTGILALGTDCPVVDIDPFVNIYAAVTRKMPDGRDASHNPNECISMRDTLCAYTYGAATAYGREDEIGRLSKGFLADIIVLNKNLFAIPESSILECKVNYTMVGGKLYEESDFRGNAD